MYVVEKERGWGSRKERERESKREKKLKLTLFLGIKNDENYRERSCRSGLGNSWASLQVAEVEGS
jgi:hypothetical protein